MTIEQKCDLIAVACGKTPCDEWKPFNFQTMMKGACHHVDCYPRNAAPNYFQFLDPCHEMEEVLHGDQWIKYVNQLGDLTKHKKGYVHATAAERAETFGQVLGLWGAGE